jgi:hypothetical protein
VLCGEKEICLVPLAKVQQNIIDITVKYCLSTSIVEFPIPNGRIAEELLKP